MENTTRSAYAALVQTNLLLDLPHNYLQASTLNEGLGINANVVPNSSEKNALRFWVGGSRGHRSVAGTNGLTLIKPLQHSATDAGLYNIVPLVLRAGNNDLTATERAKYCLRKEVSVNSAPYIAYYGRRINMQGVTSGLSLITRDELGLETATDFIPSESNLHPDPQALSNVNVNVVDNRYVRASARITIGMTEEEAAEYRNACNIIYGSDEYAVISEIALCTGVNRSISTTDQVTGNQVTMNEIVGGQINTFISSFNALAYNNKGFELSLDVGAREPLFKVTAVAVNN